jgi:hypothetical protein
LAGATIDLGNGVQITTNNGPGILADINSNVLFGFVFDPTQTSTVTINGNLAEGLRLLHMSVAQAFAGTTATGNVTADASCDGSSLLFGNLTGIAVLKCAGAEPDKGK